MILPDPWPETRQPVKIGFGTGRERPLPKTLNANAGAVLPDVLGPDLKVVFCGSAVGSASARAGAYYAGPGNKFWPTLQRIGLTPRRLAPAEFRALAGCGIGLTDLCKTLSGPDRALAAAADDVAGLAAKIERHAPRVLAFNGKRPAGVFLGQRFGLARPGYGLQTERLGPSTLFVLPSTSGAANRWWDDAPWRALADYLVSDSR